jgi:hypothetical protein
MVEERKRQGAELWAMAEGICAPPAGLQIVALSQHASFGLYCTNQGSLTAPAAAAAFIAAAKDYLVDNVGTIAA